MKPATVATLRTMLASFPDDHVVLLFDERDNQITRVLNHLTHDRRANAVVLHIKESTTEAD